MADNLDPTAGPFNASTDEITGPPVRHIQRMKLSVAADGDETHIPADATNGLDVDVTRIQGNVDVEGIAATDAPVSGNPLYMGGFASQNEPAQVSADGDVVPLWLTRKGAAVVQLSFPPNVAVTGTHGPHVQTVTALGPTAVVAAPAAGNSIHVTGVMATNSSATQTIVTLRDGTTDRLSSVLAPAGGGFVMTPISPPWKLTAATALNVTLSVAVTDVRLVVHFYIAP